MENKNMFEILERNNANITGINCDLYREFSKQLLQEKEIIEKIKEYEEYTENNNNKYSEEIMRCLREREGLSKYDFSKDEELNQMSPNEVFDNVVKWNGLLGGYSDTIKGWIREIYGVDLNEIK